jgi:pimeloyl-ACP methyl ester carboxylesterase
MVARPVDEGVAMASVVLVHGAFNELWGPHELKARWLPALRDGLWHHGQSIAAEEVEVCFYGDLFRRDPEDDRDTEFESSRAGVADALHNLLGSDVIETLEQAANAAVFDRTVDLVTTMATTPDLRERARARLEAVVDDDTRVIVAHSLGTIVAWSTLVHHRDWPVRTFVTLGSPLASPMIFDRLDPAPADGVGAWPGPVEHWVNVAAVGDRAAAAARLAERFGARVEDHRVDNGHRAHDPEPYLNNPVAGAAVLRGLGRLGP